MTTPLSVGHLMGLLAVQAEATDHPLQVAGELDDGPVDVQIAATELRVYDAAGLKIATATMQIAADLRDPLPGLRAEFEAVHECPCPVNDVADDLVREGLLMGWPVQLATHWTVVPWRQPATTWPRLPSGRRCLPLGDDPYSALLLLAQARHRETARRERAIEESCQPHPVTP